ncbi:MAG TPA: HigA family addiction module antitoxin [Gammaproteobacteria bacterium]|nr:HigA family addiction module antitoxin [Gammaproteobacteria bacterium]
MTETAPAFEPDWVSPPGETIADVLDERDWTQKDLATRLGYSEKHVSQLVTGKAPVTEDTALRLERVLGTPAGFWLAREARYRERLAWQRYRDQLRTWTDWLDELPVRDLMKAGAIPLRRNQGRNKPEIVDSLLRFFGVASPEEWRERYAGLQGAFRRTREDQSDTAAITAWLRMGERRAESIEAGRFDERRFRHALTEARALTREPPERIGPALSEVCRKAGVVVVFVDHLPRTHVSGVARWLNKHCALIQLSLYGKWNDRMWFTFFHEAAHILLHAGDKSRVFLDDPDGGRSVSDQEREADAWAADWLIPPGDRARLQWLAEEGDIRAFADDVGIHPGIVVGRMQHEDILNHATKLNRLKERFRIVQSRD